VLLQNQVMDGKFNAEDWVRLHPSLSSVKNRQFQSVLNLNGFKKITSVTSQKSEF
jgi:hypothetical protein